ncbi:acyl transferase/acyl hydrolase/lysophospholipase [Podospora fimiseda]|uniref:Acyl transferase/acyl hydrolase/lysophospholipase n=1 Tax=Podospora fimiseda TaxID=252190 RepID=A0AAN6YP17_9PEZI|nr:acyl transferase/acyl hydrolase/lysophospholipase [Podospora fimiseda]
MSGNFPAQSSFGENIRQILKKTTERAMADDVPVGNEPIAVVGSACRFPGNVHSPSELWNLLQNPRDLLQKVPETRFNIDKFYHPDGNHNGTSNVQHSYFLAQDPRHFDANFFGIKPLEANAIDPQQRLLLEVAYEALESAGLPLNKVKGTKTGVFVGLMTEDYSNIVARDLQNVPTYFASGTARSIVSNRLSYVFDLRGPSMTIDTACSSSLVAIHLAVQSLRAGESVCCLVGGSNLLLSPEQYIAGTRLKLFSAEGRSRMWDKGANGYGRGEGVAVLVLKTLSRAVQDGDHIECIIRETGVNQDGSTKGITMPSALAQIQLVRDTYVKAGLDINNALHHRPQYFEAHGTGTAAGDPIEAEAIDAIFQSRPQPLFVGSIKTVLGHSESTAGIAGVLKASLALQHNVVPPNMLFTDLNPRVRPFYTNLVIPQAQKPWPAIPQGQPRRASVNSFGFGGTNAHAIIESSPFREPDSLDETDCMTCFNFSAASDTALLSTLSKYARFIRENPGISLRDLSWTLNTRRSTFSSRISVVALKAEDLIQQLTEDGLGNSIHHASPVQPNDSRLPRILGVFTGQGAQWASMGIHLLHCSVVARSSFEKLQASLDTLPLGNAPRWRLQEELEKPPSLSRIGKAEFSQPLSTAVQIALVDLLTCAGIKLHAVIGHSSGEIAAAYAAGYISAESAIRIAYFRGHVLSTPDSNKLPEGRMLAVGTTHEDAKELIELPFFGGRLSIAAYNSPESVTLAGDVDDIYDAKEILEDEKKFARNLKVNKAYHSPRHMGPYAAAYMSALTNCNVTILNRQNDQRRERRPVWISTVTGKPITSADMNRLTAAYWADNMVKPVLFSQAVAFAANHGFRPLDTFIDIGPHPALKQPTQDTILSVCGKDVPSIATLQRGNNDALAFISTLGNLWKLFGDGVVDFGAFDRAHYGHAQSSRPPKVLKNLPRYSWNYGRRYWHEGRYSRAFRTVGDVPHSLLGTWCSEDGTTNQWRYRNYLSVRTLPWLAQHRIQGQKVFPAAGYVACVVEAIAKRYHPESVLMIEFADVRIGKAILLPEDDAAMVETLLSIELTKTKVDNSDSFDELKFTFHSEDQTKTHSIKMVENACGRVRVVRGEQVQEPLLPPPAFFGSVEFVEVDHERFYTTAREAGYGYDGVFDGLRNARRKVNESMGDVILPTGDDDLIIHPGVLDCALQSLLLAFSYPGDGRLRSLYLPTRIHLIRIDLAAWIGLRHSTDKSLSVRSNVEPMGLAKMVGDVDVYMSTTKTQTILQLQGLQCTPLVACTPQNDVTMFFETTWEPESISSRGIDWSECHIDTQFAFLLERVACYYLAKIGDLFRRGRRKKDGIPGHYLRFLQYVERCLEWVGSGTHPWAKKEWLHQGLVAHADIEGTMAQHPTSIDLRLIKTVGEAMIDSLEKEGKDVNMLKIMTKDNLLDEFYRDALGMDVHLKEISRLVKQLSGKHGHMEILEIGAGTGATTEHILRGLGESFRSYTFTDISPGFFDKARSMFTSDKMNFATLDLNTPIEKQGFNLGSYDLVIASLVLHATSNLKDSLAAIRKLLRPLGYLVLLEITDNTPLRFGLIFGGIPGWWSGNKGDGRQFSPCVTVSVWEDMMSLTGFSKLVAVMEGGPNMPIPLSVIVTQAIDHRAQFLLEPLRSRAEGLGLGRFTIIGGQSLEIGEGLKKALLKHYSEVQLVSSLSSLPLPHSGSVISMTDFGDASSVFENLSEINYTALQALLTQSKTLIWVTSGAQARYPHKQMFTGLWRSVALEMTNIRTQMIDFDNSSDFNYELVVKQLLQVDAYGAWEEEGGSQEILWSIEPELMVQHGNVLLPRLRVSETRNDRYNSTRRTTSRPLRAGETLTILDTSIKARLAFQVSSQPDGARVGKGGGIKLLQSIVNPVAVTHTMRGFISIGVHNDSQKPVIVLSDTLESIIWTSPNLVVPASADMEQSVEIMMKLYAQLQARDILQRSLEGRKIIVVLSPNKELGLALTVLATSHGVKLVLLTTDQSTVKLGHPWTYLHPLSTRKMVAKLLPGSLSEVFVYTRCNIQETLPDGIERILYDDLVVGLHHMDLTPETVRQVSANLDAAWLEYLETFQQETRSASIPRVTIDEITSSNTPMVSGGHPVIMSWQDEVPLQVPICPASTLVVFNPDRTYWLVGLTGGLGMSLCQWMASRGARNIAISSRNPVLDETWTREVASSGCTVRGFVGDITDRESVRDVHREITRSMPPIAGVAQGAMVLEDSLFQDLQLNQFERNIKPKVDGSIYLDEIFSDKPLEFFVFFSSVAYVAGNVGQSAYSAANAFMTGLAGSRRRRGLSASVVHIGAVLGNGYVTRELTSEKQMALHRAGYAFLSEQDFCEVFAEGILASTSLDDYEVTTGLRVDGEGLESAKWAANPRFQHLLSKTNSPAAMTSNTDSSNILVSLSKLVSQATTRELVHDILEEGIVAKVRRILQIDQQRSILTMSLDELGVDSLVALELQSWFRKEIGIDMPVLKILNSSLVCRLIESAEVLVCQDRLAPQETPLDALEGEISPVAMTPETSATPTTEACLTPDTTTSEFSWLPESDVQSTPRLGFERIVPLSFGQARFWFLRSLVEDKTAFNITAAVYLRGSIDTDRLGEALQNVGHRHEALRTAFINDPSDKTNPIQSILPSVVPALQRRRVATDDGVKGAIRALETHEYDLEKGETFQLHLLTLSEKSHWLLFGYHHIVLDGIGFQIFFADLQKAYDGTLDTNGADILQYPDYSIRQRKEHEENLWKEDLEYWHRQFAVTPPVLPLLSLSLRSPATRPDAASFNTHSASFRLDDHLSRRISQCCQRFRVRPFHFYAAVYSVLLFRHTNNAVKDFCIGVADANRKDVDVLHSLGLFLNLLPLRFGLHEDQTFLELLSSTKTTIEGAYSHSRPPFDIILNQVNAPRSVCHTPLFQTFLNYRQNVQETRQFCGCEAEGELISSGRHAYDVSLDIIDNSVSGNNRENLAILSVNADLYTAEDAEILQRSYLSLLEGFTNDPAGRIVKPRLYLEEDALQSVTVGVGPEQPSAWGGTLVDRITHMAEKYAERVALTDGLVMSLTYAEMMDQVCTLCQHLKKLGVRRGYCVGVCQSPGPGWICSMLAVLCTGAACVPLDSGIGMARLSEIINDCKSNVIIVDDITLEQHPLSGTQVIIFNYSDVSTNGSRRDTIQGPGSQATLSDPAFIIYTSGSTGKPKGVVLTQSAYKNFFEFTPPRWGVEEGVELKILQQSSYAFDMSLLQIFTSLCYGGTLIVLDGFRRRDPVAICDTIFSQNVTMTLATPTEYMSWIPHMRGTVTELRKSQWKCAMTGGEPLTIGLLEGLSSLGIPGMSAVNCYGPTETTIGCADRVIHLETNKSFNDLDFGSLDILPNYSVYIVDDNLTPVPVGVLGQILIGGAGVAQAYFNEPTLTAQLFPSNLWASAYFWDMGWTALHLSGDRGRLLADGRLVIHGRMEGSTQVKLRGIRIDLEEVETAIVTSCSKIQRAVVSLRKDGETAVEFLVAFLVLSAPIDPNIDARSLIRGFSLPQYMWPSVAIVMDHIPMTTSGKLDRTTVQHISLASEGETNFAASSNYSVEALTQSEESMLLLWKEVLPRDPTSLQRQWTAATDFFQAGGTSLTLASLQVLIQSRRQVPIMLRQLFESVTLGQMTALVDKLDHGFYSSPALETVNWELEATILVPKAGQSSSPGIPVRSTERIIILTGSSGFLGREILTQLLYSRPEISQIHCIAVRNPSKHLTHPKVIIHQGDLSQPNLGLDSFTAQALFSPPQAVVIHASSDVSFLKSYSTLKQTNVFSTKELIRLCYPCQIPIHFISSASVARLTNKPEFGPESVREYVPDAQKKMIEGYTATKWVSEVLLENAAKELDMQVAIHRPSSITGRSDGGKDLMGELVRIAGNIGAVPDLGESEGWMDFVSVESVAGRIIGEVMKDIKGKGKAGGGVRYVHECGEVEVRIRDIGGSELVDGKEIKILRVSEWVKSAEEAGLDGMLSEYLRWAVGAGIRGSVIFPRLLKEF